MDAGVLGLASMTVAEPPTRSHVMAPALVVSFLLAATVGSAAQDGSFPCFTHHGRLSSQNGVAIRIWLIGTKRSVGVTGELPPAIAKLEVPYLSLTSEHHSYIFGDFTICPIGPDVAGHMRLVRLTAAANLVVQDIHRQRPPFKVTSTWKPR
jgi:hypothetical protein